MSENHIPDRKRGRSLSAPGFYGSCASRRTMGSARRAGLVQRKIINAACGDNAAYGSENLHNRASPAGNAPLLVLRTTFLLKGSMSLDSQVALLPYESSSFATPEGELYLPLSFYSHKQFKV